jgi:hypothetical protein
MVDHDLDLLREHLPTPDAPSGDAKQRASARLAQAMRDDARRATNGKAQQTLAARFPRLIRTRPRSGVLALATLVAATALALFVSAPWKDSPGFLDRAQAALNRPDVLHMEMKTKVTWRTMKCTIWVTDDIWIDETPPYRYRGFIHHVPVAYPPYHNQGCWKGHAKEVGGTFDHSQALVFEPPNTLKPRLLPYSLSDPARLVSQAIDQGHARDVGETQVNGHTVHHILMHYFGDMYLDSKTGYPVASRLVVQRFDDTLGRPLWVGFVVTQYKVFEYLPRTAANLALTNIRAQHPKATGPRDVQ